MLLVSIGLWLGAYGQPMQVNDATSYFNEQSACSKQKEQQKIRYQFSFPELDSALVELTAVCRPIPWLVCQGNMNATSHISSVFLSRVWCDELLFFFCRMYESNPQTLRLSMCSVSGNENLVLQKIGEGRRENYFSSPDGCPSVCQAWCCIIYLGFCIVNGSGSWFDVYAASQHYYYR
jgi:hypothetical protein